MPPYPNFIGGAYVGQSTVADGQRLVNWYVERSEVPTNGSPWRLYPTPGVSRVALADSAPGRGSLACQGRAFCVIGRTFYEIDANYTLTSRGSVASDDNPATLCWNGDGGGQVFVTSGDNGYVFDLDANSFTQVRTGATTMAVSMDGYIIVLDAATSTIYLSDLLDATTFDPTQFAQRSIASDRWVSMAIVDRYLWLLGEDTSEPWYNAGAFPFPFQPHPSGLVQYGCKAPWSPKVIGGTLRFLSNTAHGSGAVVELGGFTPSVISSFAVHTSLDNNGTIDDAIADAYEDKGHVFYLLSLPTAGTTLSYDAAPTLSIPPAMRWAERGTWVAESNAFIASRTVHHFYAFDQHLALDRETGAVYRQSSEYGLDVDDRPIRRVMRPPALYGKHDRVVVWEFELLLESGRGAISGQGEAPQVMLRSSRNGGKTWGAERMRSAGAMGQYDTRVVWQRCGSGRRWQPEISVSDPIPYYVLGANIRAEGEAA